MQPANATSALSREQAILSQSVRVKTAAIELARKVGIPGIWEDLLQAGWIGVIQAVDRYDTKRSKLALSTVVRYRMRGAMIDWMRTGACDPQVRRKACKGTPRFDRMPDVQVFNAGLFQLDDVC
jgi:DNA-directed RNA polymerase specialized sigma subunit